jgi:hypothetical protein
MLRVSLVPFAALALLVSAVSTSGCGCGGAACGGRKFDVAVGEGVAAVEICGDPDDCVKVDAVKPSMRIQPPPPESWSMPPHRRRPTLPVEWWTVRAFDADGTVLIKQVLSPEFIPARGCTCARNIEIEVLPTAIRQTGVAPSHELPLPSVIFVPSGT